MEVGEGMKKKRIGFVVIRSILSTLLFYLFVAYPTREYFYGYRFNDYYTLNIEDNEELLLSTVVEDNGFNISLMGKVSIFRILTKSNSYAFYTGKVIPEEIRRVVEILSDYH